MSKKVYTSLGTVMKAKKKNEGDADRFYLKLEQKKDKDGKPVGASIFPIKLANGVVLNDGQIVSMFSKKEKFQKSVNEGKMDQAKADELSAFLKYDVVMVEEVNEGSGSSDDGSDINF